MLNFRRLVKISGILAALLVLAVAFVVFVGFVTNRDLTGSNSVVPHVEEEAKSIDVYRILKNGKVVYHLVASSMVRKKSGIIVLKDVSLWYRQDSKPTVMLKAARAIVYRNNDVMADGGVSLKRNDLEVHTQRVYWVNAQKVAFSSQQFKGSAKKVRFSGDGFRYYYSNDKLIAGRVDIWLR